MQAYKVENEIRIQNQAKIQLNREFEEKKVEKENYIDNNAQTKKTYELKLEELTKKCETKEAENEQINQLITEKKSIKTK